MGKSGLMAVFFVCEPKVFDYIPEREDATWEVDVLRKITQDRELVAYKHRGFWHSMDMLKDKQDLNKMWEENSAPWKIWTDKK